MEKNNFVFLGFLILGGFIATIAVYLTPLQNVRFVSPTVDFVEASEFYGDFIENPDKYVLVDIRPQFIRLDYPENSVNMSIFNLALEVSKLKDMAKGKTIVVFCEEDTSESVAYGYLEHQGFTDIKAISGGRAEWVKAGLPLVKNTNYKAEAEPFLEFFKEGGLVK